MDRKKWTLLVIFAMACCLALVLVPVSGNAQGVGGTIKHGVQKGAGTVQKGAEDAYDATKKGVEATGKGVKKAVTGEDESDREGVTQESTTTGTQSTTRTRSRTHETVQNRRNATGEKNLPATAGELPLLALAAISCLAAVGARRRTLQKRSQR